MNRKVAVFLSAAATIILLAIPTLSAAVTVLNFEDRLGDLNPIPNGYAGFNWTNFYTSDWPVSSPSTAGTGYQFGATSGVRTAFNGGGNLAVNSGNPFNFFGAYFTGAWNNNLSISVNGFLNATQKYSQTFQVNATNPTFVSLNYLNVNRLEFASFGGTPAGFPAGSGTHFVMDDFTFANVPEPSTCLLSSLAVLGGGWLLRNRSQRLA